MRHFHSAVKVTHLWLVTADVKEVLEAMENMGSPHKFDSAASAAVTDTAGAPDLVLKALKAMDVKQATLHMASALADNVRRLVKNYPYLRAALARYATCTIYSLTSEKRGSRSTGFLTWSHLVEL